MILTRRIKLSFFKSSRDKILLRPEMKYWIPIADDANGWGRGSHDPLIPLKQQFKAFSYYRLPNGHVVGLWKSALTSISKDEEEPGCTVPSEHPVCKFQGENLGAENTEVNMLPFTSFRVSVAAGHKCSDDGLNYKTSCCEWELRLCVTVVVQSYGPQYVRGIRKWMAHRGR